MPSGPNRGVRKEAFSFSSTQRQTLKGPPHISTRHSFIPSAQFLCCSETVLFRSFPCCYFQILLSFSAPYLHGICKACPGCSHCNLKRYTRLQFSAIAGYESIKCRWRRRLNAHILANRIHTFYIPFSVLSLYALAKRCNVLLQGD